ncbi:riboflavin synthase [Desulfuromonas carbonis]|uniref:riboflavin synthase n=1 Tax=Desulfuromonas sp. DDH964 TaxID=1823759 RepID=UPI00078C208C|nr:riboflavin synthase [Desulfuromonas sp. DDH964]AMV72184.1 riboflavin synthase subunit alpha [Desulfuromonas sp. DDH964]
MFTGLIEDLGTVRELRPSGTGARLTVATAIPWNELVLGESIAVNGICLTVVAIDRGAFAVDVSPETLQRSTLGRLASGNRVNLERALRLGDRLGGHLVSGHIDGTGEVVARVPDSNAIRFTIGCGGNLSRYIVPKGSVAIDGISLTVNQVEGDRFEVSIIPHTLAMTTLKHREPGARVNLEVDVIGKYVERLLGPRETPGEGGGLALETLAKYGFL